MKYIGKIDREKFKMISEDITTDDVILTEKFFKIGKKKYKQYLRNKEIVWKKLDRDV